MTGPLEHAGTATVWRPRTVPEQLALVGLACVPAAFLWPGVQAATGAQMLCPLRTLTGIPCPLCGMTRAATSLAAGDLGASLAYNPFLLVVAVGARRSAVVGHLVLPANSSVALRPHPTAGALRPPGEALISTRNGRAGPASSPPRGRRWQRSTGVWPGRTARGPA